MEQVRIDALRSKFRGCPNILEWIDRLQADEEGEQTLLRLEEMRRDGNALFDGPEMVALEELEAYLRGEVVED